MAGAPKSITVNVRTTDTVRDLKRSAARLTGRGISEDDIHISFRENVLQDYQQLQRYGMQSGTITLVPMQKLPSDGDDDQPDGITLADGSRSMVFCAAAVTSYNGNDGTITVKADKSRGDYDDLSFSTIRLSCESHRYYSRNDYAGFLLYGWENDNRKVVGDWWLNGKHCRSAYLCVQRTDTSEFHEFRNSNYPYTVHGGVYRSVFGKDSDVAKAVGEGFACMESKYKWVSGTFNANSDAYHDGQREISRLGKLCTEKILNKWKNGAPPGTTYWVKDLLG